jgi:hypothetical protein
VRRPERSWKLKQRRLTFCWRHARRRPPAPLPAPPPPHDKAAALLNRPSRMMAVHERKPERGAHLGGYWEIKRFAARALRPFCIRLWLFRFIRKILYYYRRPNRPEGLVQSSLV